jgi:antitoxin VapB
MNHTAKIFMNGRSQAVRLPKEFRFDCDEVFVRKQGDGIIISPKKATWDLFFEQKTAFDENFLVDREQPLTQEREF